ncbi:expressed unknown protein [Seminavis robusta]|uniref:Uncharacterized protein n=1 Tax=Seminavis robusta TaxID=568900 RepID=A0A9N8ERY6_9STRA|nr:expressed unknown protein [Seminavis robusta]|eukprot:Sro1515_g279000.1 n/a (169) ;mRNA; r:8151-8853
MMSAPKHLVWALLAVVSSAGAFVVRPRDARKTTTTLFLEDWVADMIDHELHRLHHKEEYEQEWMEKNRNHILHHIPQEVDGQEDEMVDIRQVAKDKKLARENPERYCADRCVATGNCEVYEDIFELGPEEVLSFCNECVLSENKEECDIPPAFYRFGDVEDVVSFLSP